MEGPRCLEQGELGSLETLVDTVFMPGKTGVMRHAFPALFNEDNRANLLVYSEEGRIVSHVGRTERWASLGGCTVRVGCVGAVATYEEYRGSSLASRLLERTCRDADASGVDFLMISGDRGLYRRAGAVSVGLDYRLVLNRSEAERLRSADYQVQPYEAADLPVWMEAYERKCAHFIRPLEDWNWALETRLCQLVASEFLSVTLKGAVCGYTVSHVSNRDGACVVAEYAGDDAAIVSVLGLLMERHNTQTVRMHVQGTQTALIGMLAKAGVLMEPVHANGTLLVLDFPRFGDRLRPWIASQVGMASAAALSVREEEDRIYFEMGHERMDFASRADATEFVFGNHQRGRGHGVFARAFPAPSLWYGLNYV
ncbi:MAG: GNAT family N-acetyltransferase [Candidatus Hydrogenedentes bacterium]|nr:GNAT family N-acetyltransferase [Candidatus Hydrogenedentota bacterium]